MKFPLLLILLVVTVTGCQQPSAPETSDVTSVPDENEIITVLDRWHNAASEADFDTYFGLFADDNSIFMGTDVTERWTVPEFKAYAKPYFDAGTAWNFTGHTRYIYFSADGKTAWFDEQLDTPNLGPSRGTGVLIYTGESWKIAHYNLTVPIPNDIVYDVVQQIDSLNTME